ncbi:NAD synthetase [Desulfosporosinus sp. Tol-M]|nr:NAD synthetase [Desulfosporosinus sp. Tol-M]
MISLNQYGFIRAGVAVPYLEVANPTFNIEEMRKLIMKASARKVQVLLFPELCVTGYSAGDLFNQRLLLESAEKELLNLLQATKETKMLIAAGIPIMADNQLFNCAVMMHEGHILGAIPKTFIPNYSEFYEKRWFASAFNRISNKVKICGREVPFNENLLLKDENSELVVGVELCEDLWMPIPPSSYHAQHGANLILNLSASNEIVGKAEYRRNLVTQQSARCMAAYLYTSAGNSESTTDVVYGGHAMIAENGTLLAEDRMNEEETLLIRDLDIELLSNDRRKFNSFIGNVDPKNYETVSFSLTSQAVPGLERHTNPQPFVPSNKEDRDERCREIFRIQAAGLAQRLAKTGIQKAVLGISGGLDSTLALLVTCAAFEKLKLPQENIIGVTMPGFGTSGRTYRNSYDLMKGLGVTTQEISIKEACIQHLTAIGHNLSGHDITYENAQARERTQILMDIANQVGGLVVGTGDLSELALGWCTYNGDQMSMYGVNSGVPKTLVRYLVTWYAEGSDKPDTKNALLDILETPVSPELLPPDELGNIEQKTEDIVGPYTLHDFFLYNMLRFGYTPSKIVLLAENAFQNYEKEEIVHWLRVFCKRFFSQQFKRSAMPDGVKVGSISLSPRGDWRMPSDASAEIWLKF